MKKILSTLALFFVLCMPAFAQSVFVPNITSAQAKSAVISHMIGQGWSLKGETEHSTCFYKTELAHDEAKYKQEELIYNKMKEAKKNDKDELEFSMKHPVISAYKDVFVDQPQYWNSTNTTELQFYFFEDNGVTIQTDSSSTAIKDMMRTLFVGHYSFNIKYSIKKDYVKISDTPNTYYNNQTRLGNNRKVIKINDKSIREYGKSNLKNLLDNCTQEQIKLETNDSLGNQIFYINRTFIEPTYKQFVNVPAVISQ